MRTLCLTDFAIALANARGTLRLELANGRHGPYVAINDDKGVIEIQWTVAEAEARIRQVSAGSALQQVTA